MVDLGRKIGNRRVETHAGPSILSYFTEKTKCTNPSFRLLPSFCVSAVKDPVTVGGGRERFHFSSRISSKSRVLLAADPQPAVILYIRGQLLPRNLPLLALNLANWTTGRFASGTYLPTRRTAQLFNCCAGKFRINYAWAAIPRRNSGTIRSFAVSLIVFALCLPNFRILLYNSGGFCFRLFLFHTNIFLHLPKNTTIFWRKVINLDPI